MNEKSLFKSNEEGSLKSLKSGFHVDISGSTSFNNEGGIRVGVDFQADLPDCISQPYVKGSDDPISIMVWRPNADNLDFRVDHYLEISAEKYGYNQEQALGLLFWHDHNVDKSLSDLPNFVPIPEHWDTMDQVLFEQAFAFYGKNFHRIHTMMNEKSVGSLVKYYYSWKRLRNKSSGMDKKMDNYYKKLTPSRPSSSSSEGSQDNEMKSTTYIQSKGSSRGCKVSQPSVSLDIISLQQLAVVGPQEILKKMEQELLHLQRKVVSMRANINHFKLKNNFSIEHLRPPETNTLVSPKWTQDEMLLCVLGFSRYGKDYEKIGELIGSKDETLVENFFHNYRQRYNLDFAIAEYQKDFQKEVYKNMDKETLEHWRTERQKTKDQNAPETYYKNQSNPILDPNRADHLNLSTDGSQSNAPIHQSNKFNAISSNHKSSSFQFDRYNQLRPQYGSDYFNK